MIVLAFISGICGAVLGGTQAFILYGFVGLILTIAGLFMPVPAVMSDVFHNTFLLPAVMFNGNVLATAYAAKKYDIKGWDINHSLVFTKDIKVFLLGGIGSVIGYLVFRLFETSGIPIDCGAVTVFLVEVLFRIIFQRGSMHNQTQWDMLMKRDRKYAVNEIIMAAVTALCAALLVKFTGMLMLPFYLSAISLLLPFLGIPVNATHQITMPAAYAFAYSHNILFAVIVGILGEVIFVLFGNRYNTDMRTHIDPPAVSIALCSLLVFTLFA